MPALKVLAQEADESNTVLSTMLLPDDGKDESYDLLKHAFAQVGFKPFEADGEVYPTDLSRQPNKKEEPVAVPPEDLKTIAYNQIEALTLAREFADDAEKAEIDNKIDVLNISLNFI